MPAILEESRNKLKVMTAAMSQNEMQASLVLHNDLHGFVTIMTGKKFCLNGTDLSSEEVKGNRLKGGVAIFSSLSQLYFCHMSPKIRPTCNQSGVG